jgi:hypothetical protein
VVIVGNIFSNIAVCNLYPTLIAQHNYCESAGTHVIAMVEAIIGNINHLSKNAILDYSC